MELFTLANLAAYSAQVLCIVAVARSSGRCFKWMAPTCGMPTGG